MALIRNSKLRPRILIVGGGYLGLVTAQNLLKNLGRGEATVTVVDPNPYMTYAPFLPEVAGGSIEARHAIVPLRRNLKGAEVVIGSVRNINHAEKFVTIEPEGDEAFELDYDYIVLAAGAVARALPIPGLADEAIGLKRIEEAVALRDHVLNRLDEAALMEDDEERRKALTFVFVGGGFAGIEALAELEDMVRAGVRERETLTDADVRFVLVEAMPRVMPEVGEAQARWVVDHLRSRGIDVYLETFLEDCTDKVCKLSNGEQFTADTIVWNAGVKANPVLVDSDLPLDDRGRVTVRADLRVEDENGVVEGAWAAGDNAAVPDLTGDGPGGFCVPNAQHAVRQAPVLAANLLASLRGETEFKQYYHKSLGVVAGMGLWKGVSQMGKTELRGPIAWAMHRAYHGYAIPTVDRKVRVFVNWGLNLVLGRDLTPVKDLDVPRKNFVEAANSKPAPKK
ncbi:NADH dehydrogenase [Brevibacterium sp. HMSC08F02]|uniref:NAD(P)/FAD-dependent oxidoreductase n=2 Tax=Brevibacterium TaxID=1696 RepID=A0A150HB68_9MICO|nr:MULTISPECIES: NAD(P)/FAD-dependent oxidoreductase [Brevibacterium]KXZ59363.1 NADH dehydrogenase-like protein [Brevibacterium ravenspurgense]MCG7300233.1 NAD(P)/FAD-dependent oxidoreductase [Brevibacterium ravenspurgense]OFT26577.1 NADH dehydrogenase [Brevibacterium sp. HMSC08F02]OFT91784.1 NADH dehydrogenase [Brevibacterium sp. HMSC24B04]PKY69607.1 NAD(P)/FAD-dependent oxidoreductase [Brevibacterium ravenspurgense]